MLNVYVPEKDHSFAHLSLGDREQLLRSGALVAEFYATSQLRDKDGNVNTVPLHKYVAVTGMPCLRETIRNNRIVLET